MFATVLVEFNLEQVDPAIEAALADKNEATNTALMKLATRGNLVRNIWRD